MLSVKQRLGNSGSNRSAETFDEVQPLSARPPKLVELLVDAPDLKMRPCFRAPHVLVSFRNRGFSGPKSTPDVAGLRTPDVAGLKSKDGVPTEQTDPVFGPKGLALPDDAR